MLPEPIVVTLLVTKIFEQLKIPYLIGGSMASTIYGMVRTTQDVDIIADMHLEHVKPFVTPLKNEFFLDEEMIGIPSSIYQVLISSTVERCLR